MPIHRYPGGVINADNVTPGANQASGVWTLESQLQANGAGNWPQSTSQMSRSLRFNVADSAYLTRTPAVAGNRRTWTWSAWIKRSAFTGSNSQYLFSVFDYSPNNLQTGVRFTTSETIEFWMYTAASSYTGRKITSAVYRDMSAWYHIVATLDTTNATANDRMRLYVNGVQVTAFGTSTNPAQNTEGQVNRSFQHILGAFYDPLYNASPLDNFNGYMTEIVFVDGQALDATYFGYTDSNNVWQPKPYSGSVGTNGFYLTFADNTGVTPTALGKDYSNRGNNWTPVNFSVASGADNDSLVDVPTNWGTDTGLGGEVRGNYCTINPLGVSTSTPTISNGNLQMVLGIAQLTRLGTIAVTSGKWYWEVVYTAATAFDGMVGVATSNTDLSTYVGANTTSWGYYYTGSKYSNASPAAYGNSWTLNDVIGVALDMDNGAIYFSKNGVFQNSGVPTSGASKTGAAFTNLTGLTIAPAYNGYGGTQVINHGQRPFAYAAPSGFKTLCTQNLPTPTVQNGGQYFNAVLYTGNSSGASVTGVGFAPDFIWTKSRSNTTNHELIDIVRGGSSTLFSNLTNAQATQQRISAFGSDGWTYTTDSNSANTGYTFVGWNWNAGGSNATNTSGSITSTVRANTTAGFSVVTFTGTGANATVGHGLGVALSMVIVKSRSSAINWAVWHTRLTSGVYGILLDTTGAEFSQASLWNSTIPTSSVFSVGTANETNKLNDLYVAYCFSAVAGYSTFGSYIGNASADGPFIYTGFRPAYVMVKPSSAAGSWWINDSKRDPYNVNDHRINANTSDAEATASFTQQDFLSNGFKWRNADSAWNGSGVTYIYAAFAENPFKIARAR